jgi:hypothetical protein
MVRVLAQVQVLAPALEPAQVQEPLLEQVLVTVMV